MDTIYVVHDTYDGRQAYFRSRTDAKDRKADWIEDLHERFCNKKEGSTTANCLCVKSQGRQQCAMHARYEEMEDHSFSDCEEFRDEVHVEEIEIE